MLVYMPIDKNRSPILILGQYKVKIGCFSGPKKGPLCKNIIFVNFWQQAPDSFCITFCTILG